MIYLFVKMTVWAIQLMVLSLKWSVLCIVWMLKLTWHMCLLPLYVIIAPPSPQGETEEGSASARHETRVN